MKLSRGNIKKPITKRNNWVQDMILKVGEDFLERLPSINPQWTKLLKDLAFGNINFTEHAKYMSNEYLLRSVYEYSMNMYNRTFIIVSGLEGLMVQTSRTPVNNPGYNEDLTSLLQEYTALRDVFGLLSSSLFNTISYQNFNPLINMVASTKKHAHLIREI